ncbi:hypothetical protein Bbelb_051220 [Branchiostoma belcheri]|nr:hypothetical protein Bbelb_051220 [Branchiostoma belcheri]
MDAKLHKSYVPADGCTKDALLRELQKIPKGYLANNNARVGDQVLGKIRVERPAFVPGFRPSLLTGRALFSDHKEELFLENMQDAVKEAGPHQHNHGPDVGAARAAKIAARVKAVAEKDLFQSAAAIVDNVLLEELGDSPCHSLRKPEHLARAANRHRQKLRPTEPKDMTRITSQRLSSGRMCG